MDEGVDTSDILIKSVIGTQFNKAAN